MKPEPIAYEDYWLYDYLGEYEDINGALKNTKCNCWWP